MDCWFSILFMVVLASIADAASSPQDYWKSMLPGTPMPAAVRDLLLPDVDTGFKRVRIDELATSEIGRASATSFYKKGLGMGKLANAMIAKGRATNFYRKGFGMDRLDNAQSNRASITNLYKQGLGMKRLADAQIGLSMESLTNAGNIGNGDTLGMATSLHMDDVANFFLEKDLEPGMKMRLDFSRCTPEMAFLPRAAVSSIPFSSEKLSHILSHFSVQPYSAEADTMRTTLQDCEEDSLDEVKYCPTSLESMVDFATSALGTRDIEVVSSEFAKVGAAKQE